MKGIYNLYNSNIMDDYYWYQSRRVRKTSPDTPGGDFTTARRNIFLFCFFFLYIFNYEKASQLAQTFAYFLTTEE